MRLNIQLFANEISTTSTSVTIGDTIRVNITTDASYKVTLMFFVYDSKTEPKGIDTSSPITGNYYDYVVKENVYDVLKETTGTLMISGMVESYQGDSIGFTNDINLTLTVPKLPTKLVNVNKTVSALAIGGKSTAKDDEELFENYMASKFYKDIEATNVVSRNLFNKRDIIYNYKFDEGGNVIPSTSNFCYNKKYINCSGHKKLIISGASTTQNSYLIFYDNNKNFIDWFGFINRTIDIPSNAVYFRVSCDTSYLDTIQIEFEEQTSYVPYLNLEEAMQENNFYSTSEQRIGTWINGKPLYRKVIEYINTSDINATGTTLTINIPHSISNLQLVTNARGFTSGGWMFPLIVGTGTTFTNTTGIYAVNINNIQLRVTNDRWTSNGHFYFVLEYTKTTD